jgi:hypothetical protein
MLSEFDLRYEIAGLWHQSEKWTDGEAKNILRSYIDLTNEAISLLDVPPDKLIGSKDTIKIIGLKNRTFGVAPFFLIGTVVKFQNRPYPVIRGELEALLSDLGYKDSIAVAYESKHETSEVFEYEGEISDPSTSLEEIRKQCPDANGWDDTEGEAGTDQTAIRQIHIRWNVDSIFGDRKFRWSTLRKDCKIKVSWEIYLFSIENGNG